MANLVAPRHLLQPTEERIIEFKGINRRHVVEDGEMSDMLNLTSDEYPMLTPRKPRGLYTLPTGASVPLRMITRYGKIALIAKDENEDVHFYFDGNKVDAVTGLDEQTRMVAINTKVCFFPQKTYIEIRSSGSAVSVGSFGHLEESYSQATDIAVAISNEDARLTLTGNHTFKYDDAVDLVGLLTYTSGGVSKTASCNVSCIIEQVVGGNVLVLPRETFIELTGEGATNIKYTGLITRECPDLDHVLEWNNRLWGASSKDNTIYACKLGDPTNWKYYQGTGLDSYYAQQGTDGVWTGCAPYSSHVIFFKQNSMTKVYGSSPATFQVANVQCYGVEEGSRLSVTVINDKVFYKSVIGIMVYDGGTPYCISDKITDKFRNVIGGTEGQKYYASVLTSQRGYELFVFDISKGYWHKEDSVRFHDCCTLDNKLYFIKHESEALVCSNDVICSDWLPVGEGTATQGDVWVVNPLKEAERQEDIRWMAQFGPFDEWMENRKIYSRLLLRLVRDQESEVKVYISINEGEWELVQEFNPAKTGGDFIPIIPRRCDRYSVKIEGKGKCSVKTLTRKVRLGTGGRL